MTQASAALQVVPELEWGAMTAAQFRRCHVEPGCPVVFRGFLLDWPACTTWTPKAFAARFPTATVLAMRNAADESQAAGPYELSGRLAMADFVEHVLAAEGSDLYLVAHSQFLRQPTCAALWDDMVFDPEWFDAARKLVSVNLWMGPKGTVTPLHFDLCDVLLTQAHGTKRILLAAPDQTPHLYARASGYAQVDPEQIDLEAFPLLRGARFFEAVLERGDALYIPRLWWHHVRSLTTSISLSLTNFA